MSARFQPASLGGGSTLEASCGGVLSTLTPTAAVAVFPATSVALPSTTWSAPSVAIVTGAETVVTPERSSVAPNVTVVSARFQPARFGAGSRDGVTVGGVLSRLTVTIALAFANYLAGREREAIEQHVAELRNTALIEIEDVSTQSETLQ